MEQGETEVCNFSCFGSVVNLRVELLIVNKNKAGGKVRDYMTLNINF